LGPGILPGALDTMQRLCAPGEPRPQKKDPKALDYGSPWNATAFPKVFLVLFVHKKNSTLLLPKKGYREEKISKYKSEYG
jgi:hypothetical protein